MGGHPPHIATPNHTNSRGASRLSGVLDHATYGGNAHSDIGGLTYTSPTLTWTGDLAVGSTATITYSVAVLDPATGDKTIINPGSSTAVGSTCPPASGNPQCRSTVGVFTPALTIVKTANLANATLGSTVTYTVKVTNTGQTSYTSAAFTDSLTGVLDDAVYDNNATATSGTVGYTDPVVSWSGALNPGGSATITYSVTIKNLDTGNGSMTNTVASATVGNNCATGSTDTRCTAVVAVTNAVSLTFTTTADVASTTDGGVVNYTVTAHNSAALLMESVSFTDSLDGILDDAAYDGNAVASVGSVGFSTSNLTWTGDIPAGGTVTVTYSVTVHNPSTGNLILAGTVTSTLPPGSDNCPSGSSDPRCTVTVPIARLLIQQGYAQTTTTPGSVVRLSATFKNTGQMPYQGITIVSSSADTVDDAIPNGDQTADSGTLVLTATEISWTGNIPVGATVTVTGTLTVKNPVTGNGSCDVVVGV